MIPAEVGQAIALVVPKINKTFMWRFLSANNKMRGNKLKKKNSITLSHKL